jgi:antirestriction protein ArdC
MQRTEEEGIYTRIASQIVSHLERGVRPWVRPWHAEHAAGGLLAHSSIMGSPTAE